MSDHPHFDATQLPHPLVKPWDKGLAVAELQGLLRAHGYPLRVDGEYGWLTEVAVNQFQSRHKIRVDGVIRVDTWVALRSTVKAGSRPVKQGDSGYDVYELQGLLQVNGYDDVPRNGFFCDQTHRMVIQFQKHCHLLADGVVDAINWAVLEGSKKLPQRQKTRNWFLRTTGS